MNHSAASAAPAMWDGWASSTDQATFENPPVQMARIPLEAAQALPTQKEVRGCRSRLQGTGAPSTPWSAGFLEANGAHFPGFFAPSWAWVVQNAGYPGASGIM